ncbi:gliding motility-associated C-terminal domain-containing protein [Pedobacter sp. UBA5917]|jgi:gliding motility-associated-like protein/uncharacterized repeat protein (TIGR01451 family)|uniref:T9SS type B sorting domain-containing protein n=1 Tax=Pedobacter sp. UBA5917 TaxID=1947061 RepID=UPI0025EB18A4|nr:gliding motility-associated C-terminal domain-containing protein [Pedobacter sp. UBA5917]
MGIKSYIPVCFILLFIFSEKAKGQSSQHAQKYILKRGAVAILHADAAESEKLTWYKNDILLPGESATTLSVRETGIYKVIAENATGCPSPPTIVEIIGEQSLPADVAIVKRSETREILSNQVFSYYLNVRNNGTSNATNLNIVDRLPDNLTFEGIIIPSEGQVNYDATLHQITWQIPLMPVAYFAELEIRVKAKQPGFISNTATISATEFDPKLSNNTSTDNKQISALHVHNVFTPNGDGKNDTFFIDNLNSFEFNELTVINRYGSTVYQEKDYKNNWEGSGLSDGTYFYIIRVRNGTSAWVELNGYVTLLK